MSQLGIYLAASGILIAVLSLWAQLWYRYAEDGKGDEDKVIFKSATLGILWIYIAIFIALLSFSLVILNGLFDVSTLGLAAGFGIASLLMGTLNIGESIVSICIKIQRGRTAFDPAVNPNKNQMKWWRIWIIVLAILLCLFSSLGMICNKAFFIGDLVFIVAGISWYICMQIRTP